MRRNRARQLALPPSFLRKQEVMDLNSGMPLKEENPPGRKGFTVVELLVAVVILAVGVLGMAATSAVVLRQMTGAKTQTNAAQLAQSRIELVTGKVCPVSASTGTAVTGAVTETWTITPTANGTVTMNVSVAFEGRTNPESFTTVIACF